MLIDGHIHFDSSADPKKILEALELTEAASCALETQIYTTKINQNIDNFYAKLICGDKVYIDGAMDAYLYYHHDKMNEMPEYLERMVNCGIDGIKMIEGKPTTRKEFDIPNFDDPLFDPTFAYLEKKKLNITWHVNDPEEFWDDKLVPDWARRSGWFYADGTFVNNMDQYHQIENLLNKHPNLSITFAHFYFLSDNLKELSRLFEKFPNISVDLTPGIEMYTNMSKNIEEAKLFFNKYYDRIIYGTDINIDKSELNELNRKDALTRKNLVHEFLTKDHFTLKGDPDGLLGSDDLTLNGLALDKNKVEYIEYKNFLKRHPINHPLNIDLILEEIEIHKNKLRELNLDSAYLDKIKEEFLKHK